MTCKNLCIQSENIKVMKLKVNKSNSKDLKKLGFRTKYK